MKSYIDPPKRMNPFLKLAVWLAERQTGKEMLAARILAWYPKAAVGAGALESLVAHRDRSVSERLLKLVRMQVSFHASCPFCIDMNSSEYAGLGITKREIEGLQGLVALEDIESLSERETLALRYAKALTETPINVSAELLESVLKAFSEREMVIIVSTAAQVNFWTRMIQGFGVPPAGFSETCAELHLERYTTLR